MKNKVVRKLLMVGLSSSVVLTSTVGVTAASMDATTTDVVVENAAEDEVLTPVEGEEAVTEETSEEVAEEETTEETGEEVAEEETTEETGEEVAEEETTEETDTESADEDLQLAVDIHVWYVDQATGEGVGDEVIAAPVRDGVYYLSSKNFTVPDGYTLITLGDFSGPCTDSAFTAYVEKVETPEHTAKTVQINYQLENGTSVGKGSITVEPQYTEDKTVYYNFNYSQLTDVPEGYEIAVAGDCDVTDVTDADQVNVTVKEVKAENRTVFVSFEDEETGKILPDVAAIQIANDATQFNTSLAGIRV